MEPARNAGNTVWRIVATPIPVCYPARKDPWMVAPKSLDSLRSEAA